MFNKLYKRFVIYFILIFVILFILKINIYSSEYKTDYTVEYFLETNQNIINSLVKYRINIKNLSDKLYVNKFFLILPDTFSISNVQANDDYGPIEPNILKKDNKVNIELTFSNPKKEINTENNFYLSFNQSNLFTINGNVWEVILPIIETRENENYEVTVYLPGASNKKISISKPIPDNIIQNKIYWKNPKTKTIYAVFGDYQIYKAKLKYNLYNPRYTKVYTDVAFPPDTDNQKIFVQKIDPLPDLIYLDKDDNYIGRYILKPKETKIITYESDIKITAISREEVKNLSKQRFLSQKKYLLNESKLWKISDLQKYRDLNSPENIYNYIVNNFTYDYSRINQDIKRLGADFALNNPKNVICTEFSDSFIALSREKGIYSREIQGYGFSQNLELRPLSLADDILHSWLQYYNKTNNQWTSVDPTWQNTSGIDYFSSFDLNHIAFVIHGLKPDYPLPAGMYKINNSKDVEISATNNEPQEVIDIKMSKNNVPKNVMKNNSTKSSIIIKNNGNTFIYNIPVLITSDVFDIKYSTKYIDILAPYQEKNIDFTFINNQKKSKYGKIKFKILNNPEMSIQVQVLDITRYLLLPLVVLLAVFFLILFKKIKKIKII